MFSVGIRREFQAQHFLIGGDWGAENQPHSHDYVVEVELEGQPLDEHGYLLDIDDIKRHLDDLLSQFEGRMLNSLPDFEGLNPSLERFARILCAALANRVRNEQLSALTIKLWEDPVAWASYRLEF